MTNLNAIPFQRGGVFLCLMVGGFLTSAAHAEEATCESIYQSVESIAAKDDRELPAIPKTSPDAARKKFIKQYAPLEATVSAKGVPFSASKMLDRLWKLYGLARASGDCSPELSQLLTTVATVEFKRGYPGEASAFAEAALSTNDLDTPDRVGDAIYLHDQLADALHDAPTSIKHMQAAVDLAPRDPSLEPLQRFGLRQDLGFWLHEGKRFDEARQVNAQLLADAMRELGADDVALLGVLENLAQNYYELKQLGEADAYLKRCLALARKHARKDVESRIQSQRAVLARETGGQ